MTYSDKLRDPRWQKKRLLVMQRDGFRCAYCGDQKSTLNVHHLKYGRDPWDTVPDHLVTLCEGCHEMVEDVKKSILAKFSFNLYFDCFCKLNDLLGLEVDTDKVLAALNALEDKK
jgi:hypothetical protein